MYTGLVQGMRAVFTCTCTYTTFVLYITLLTRSLQIEKCITVEPLNQDIHTCIHVHAYMYVQKRTVKKEPFLLPKEIRVPLSLHFPPRELI